MENNFCCDQTKALRRNRYVSKLPKTYYSSHSKYLDNRSKTFERNNMHYSTNETNKENNSYRSNNCCGTHVYKTSNQSMKMQGSEMSSGYMYKLKMQCKCIR